MQHKHLLTVLFVAVVTGFVAVAAHAQQKPQPRPSAVADKTAAVTAVATFSEVPVGVATSKGGRTFLAFSRAIDPKVSMSVGELKNGSAVAFPPGFRQDDGTPSPQRLLSVQALYVDSKDRLWILDTGKVGTNAVEPGTAKLIAWDLGRNAADKTITFPADVAGPTSFLNDVRVDLTRGPDGTAFITDASPEGPNGIVVVDLASGRAVRRLHDHPSTKPVKSLTLTVQGEELIQKKGPTMGQPFRVGADGIALSADGAWVYYSPLTSHRLYRVSAAALVDQAKTDADVAKTVADLGDKGFAADGLLGDAQNRLYVTDFEQHAIHRRTADGRWEMIAQSPDLRWPDTMALLPDGTLLVTATQIDRSPRFQGVDERERPFRLFAVKTDSKPLLR